ncbi:cytochrome P450 4C1-like [Trichoplusia ni]|uniref:Cytochrome P450 4C1-like n=1 Tax=Trichoplusia ni TaxID=7111 RepID=A0A7E5VM38_TRINI|nr:cytochrome P450 4C1-like [Trichoplusia ni]
MFVVVVLIVTWCAVMFVWSWVRPRSPSPPTYPGSLPLIGNVHQMIGDAVHWLTFEKKLFHFCLKNGGIVKLLFGPHQAFVMTEPDECLTIANTCMDKPYFYSFAKDCYGRGLVTANESTWKPHRKLLNPAFNLQVLNTFIAEFNVQAKDLVSLLEPKVGKEPFDVQPYLVNMSLKTVCRTSLGFREKDQRMIDTDYAHATEALFLVFGERIPKLWLHLPQLYNLSSLKKKEDNFGDVFFQVIKNRRSELKLKNNNEKSIDTKSDKFKPLLDQMLELAENQDAFSDEEIREHLDTIVAAAYDTTATSVTYTLVLIGSDAQLQERIWKELKSVLGDEDRDVTKNDLPKLVYLEAVLKESLRLYPPVPFVARDVTSDIQIRNYKIPAGSSCFLALYGINRHPMWGADAEEFRPERWLDPDSLPINPNAFASFSIGKRVCLGRSYGMMAMKTTLAHILRRYRVFGDINKVVSRSDILMKPVTGQHIKLELRTRV